jgi:hypothetical protein
VLGNEPDFQLVGADDIADDQIVGAVVSIVHRLPSHGTRLLEHDLVPME